MKILIAPNSFKKSLSSVEVSEILSEVFNSIEGIEIINCPLSDGGDGFLEVVEYYFSDSVTKKYYEVEFAGKEIQTPVLIDYSKKAVYIESAKNIGLSLLKDEELNPLYLNSSTLGQLIKKILDEDSKNQIPFIEEFIIGVGGTATIDFGLGALEPLGFRFLDDKNQNVLPFPNHLLQIKKINKPRTDFNKIIKCIIDVETKLLGEVNAIDIYGPQKGASKEDLHHIRKGIENIISILKLEGYEFDEAEINGAGGGLAAGLNILLNAELISSKDFILNYLIKEKRLNQIDYVVTSEGKFDNQSFEGKVTGEIIKIFYSKVKKIFVICGSAEDNIDSRLPSNVEVIELKSFFNSIDESIINTEAGIRLAAEKVLHQFN